MIYCRCYESFITYLFSWLSLQSCLGIAWLWQLIFIPPASFLSLIVDSNGSLKAKNLEIIEFAKIIIRIAVSCAV